jgi:hypothetical protein
MKIMNAEEILKKIQETRGQKQFATMTEEQVTKLVFKAVKWAETNYATPGDAAIALSLAGGLLGTKHGVEFGAALVTKDELEVIKKVAIELPPSSLEYADKSKMN